MSCLVDLDADAALMIADVVKIRPSGHDQIERARLIAKILHLHRLVRGIEYLQALQSVLDEFVDDVVVLEPPGMREHRERRRTRAITPTPREA